MLFNSVGFLFLYLPIAVIRFPAPLSVAATDMMKSFKNKQSLAGRFSLPNQPYGLLQRYKYLYLEALLKRAKSRGVEIAFLYLPFFRAPKQPIAAEHLSQYGKMLRPADLLSDPSVWQNASHLNHVGATRLSAWVAEGLTKH